ncbi:caskin-1-like [Ananas comosus]|uniref:Caskin-1-like n=1 Tax=Ananas comosus TaxID=4615 RepID=A0A6P5EC51_ANACO|nr:caskin-1-like [Ananas comosus]
MGPSRPPQIGQRCAAHGAQQTTTVTADASKGPPPNSDCPPKTARPIPLLPLILGSAQQPHVLPRTWAVLHAPRPQRFVENLGESRSGTVAPPYKSTGPEVLRQETTPPGSAVSARSPLPPSSGPSYQGVADAEARRGALVAGGHCPMRNRRLALTPPAATGVRAEVRPIASPAPSGGAAAAACYSTTPLGAGSENEPPARVLAISAARDPQKAVPGRRTYAAYALGTFAPEKATTRLVNPQSDSSQPLAKLNDSTTKIGEARKCSQFLDS